MCVVHTSRNTFCEWTEWSGASGVSRLYNTYKRATWTNRKSCSLVSHYLMFSRRVPLQFGGASSKVKGTAILLYVPANVKWAAWGPARAQLPSFYREFQHYINLHRSPLLCFIFFFFLFLLLLPSVRVIHFSSCCFFQTSSSSCFRLFLFLYITFFFLSAFLFVIFFFFSITRVATWTQQSRERERPAFFSLTLYPTPVALRLQLSHR